MKKEKIPSQEQITRTPFPGSKKVFVKGSIHNINVAMREIALEDTQDNFNQTNSKNAPVTIYDTSGPYTDPNIKIDVKRGLDPMRQQWILDRGDVEELEINASTTPPATLNMPTAQGLVESYTLIDEEYDDYSSICDD